VVRATLKGGGGREGLTSPPQTQIRSVSQFDCECLHLLLLLLLLLLVLVLVVMVLIHHVVLLDFWENEDMRVMKTSSQSLLRKVNPTVNILLSLWMMLEDILFRIFYKLPSIHLHQTQSPVRT
jgi:hypothetical protein